MLRHLIVAAIVMALAGCTALQPRAQTNGPGCGAGRTLAEGGERATLWMRMSAEYRASAEGTYRSALQGLQNGLAVADWSAESTQTGDISHLPPAIVMDIDETVLDNSTPQAQMLLNGTCPGGFDALWDVWVAKRAAPAVPGAAVFIRAARELKDSQGRRLRVFLITNRECRARASVPSACPQQDDTLANLQALGLDTATLADDVMLRNERPDWVSEKLSRRRLIAQEYRIVVNVGDDLADFLPDVRRQSPAEREQARCRHHDWWGERWFVIPNPVYGSWQRALGSDLEAALAQPPPADCAAAN